MRLRFLYRLRWIVALSILISTGCSTSLPKEKGSGLTVGAKAPPLVLHTLDGQNIATDDLHGKVVIITFWATWCEPCRDELPLLSDYAAQHPQDLQILGFSLDGPEDMAKVQEVAAKLKFPVGLLGDPWAGDYGPIWRIPVSFIIDRTGRLVDDGWKDKQPVLTKERLEQVVDPLLSRSAS